MFNMKSLDDTKVVIREIEEALNRPLEREFTLEEFLKLSISKRKLLGFENNKKCHLIKINNISEFDYLVNFIIDNIEGYTIESIPLDGRNLSEYRREDNTLRYKVYTNSKFRSTLFSRTHYNFIEFDMCTDDDDDLAVTYRIKDNECNSFISDESILSYSNKELDDVTFTIMVFLMDEVYENHIATVSKNILDELFSTVIDLTERNKK